MMDKPCNCINCGAPMPTLGKCEYCLTTGVAEPGEIGGSIEVLYGWAPIYPELSSLWDFQPRA